MIVYKKIIIVVCMLVIDLIWLKFVLLKPFSNMIANIQHSPLQLKMPGAITSYGATAMIALIYLPKITKLESFLLGFLVFLVYDATNYATINNWSLRVAIMDTLWGGILFFALKHITDIL